MFMGLRKVCMCVCVSARVHARHFVTLLNFFLLF